MDSVRQQKVNKLLAKELAEIFRSNSRNLFAGGFISYLAKTNNISLEQQMRKDAEFLYNQKYGIK